MHYSLVLVGAHDGSKTEKLVDSACNLGQVLLIEPVPWLCNRLESKYKNSERIQICNFAISIDDSEEDFFAPVESANEVAPWGDQLGSLNPTHAQQHDPRFRDKIVSIKVRTLSFKSLIETYGISSIDTLMTDTEGYDAKILAAFPFEKIKPRQIWFEHKHSDGMLHIGRNFAYIVTMLEILDYQLQILDAKNCLATLRTPRPPERGTDGTTVVKKSPAQVSERAGELGTRPYEIDEDGKLRPVYQPLICTIAYGSDVYFECLRSLLESLVEFGHYSGQVAIFSDRTMEQLQEYVPGPLRSRVTTETVANAAYSARYRIAECDIGKYSPVLYIDSDVIVNTDVNPILRSIAARDGICVTTEELLYGELCSTKISDVQDVRRIGNWFGLEILRADPECADELLPLANSGIIGFKDHNTFKMVADLIYQLYHHSAHRDLATYFTDQPFLNYVLVKTGLGAYQPLRGTCAFMGNWQPFPEEKRGFVHFVWARGEEKSRQMKLYLDHLRAAPEIQTDCR
jgi:FkbM family methyltransferase